MTLILVILFCLCHSDARKGLPMPHAFSDTQRGNYKIEGYNLQNKIKGYNLQNKIKGYNLQNKRANRKRTIVFLD